MINSPSGNLFPFSTRHTIACRLFKSKKPPASLIQCIFKIFSACACVCSVVSDSLWPHGKQPARLLCPQDSQARILDWVAISSSKWSTWLRDQTRAFCVSCIGRQILKSLSHLESPRFSILLLIYVCVSHIFIGKLCNIRSNIQGLWNACIHSDSPPVGECVVWREHTSLCQLGF